MEKAIIILTGIVVLIFFSFAYYLIQNYLAQFIAVCGKKHRKGKAFYFETSIYQKKLIKSKYWVKRKNSGPDPKTYNKKINYIKHLTDIDCIIQERGL